MARPQLEDGHCDIANELLEAIIKTHFNCTEHAIFWAIVRKTYGWHKKIDRISFTQLEELTGINRRHIAPALLGLIKRNIIIRQGENRNLEYGVQKDYEKWAPLPKEVTQTITYPGNETVTDLGNEPLPKRVTVTGKQSLPLLVPIITSFGTEPLPIQVMKSLPIQVNTKERKIITKETIQKKEYGEFNNVLLKDEEYEKLKVKPGKAQADDLIEQLSAYMKQNPANVKKYVDHYATILNWARRDGRKDDGQFRRNPKALPKQYTRVEDL